MRNISELAHFWAENTYQNYPKPKTFRREPKLAKQHKNGKNSKLQKRQKN